MSSSPQYLFGYDRDGNLRFDSERAAIRFVGRLEESHNFCDWCYVPLRGETSLDDLPLQTCRTFDSRADLVEGVPPDKLDEYGGVLEISRDERHICACGWIDEPNDNRGREKTKAHMENILAVLEENGADVSEYTARGVVNDAFNNRRSGQFVEVVGEAIYYALED